MKTIVQHPIWGQITYNENIWTGKKSIALNRLVAQRVSKKEFLIDNKRALIDGDYLRGATLYFDNETIELSPKPKWYEIALSLLPILFLLTWGNNPSLCAIFPVIGGALGGALGGFAIIISLMLMKKTQATITKVLIGIGILAATVLIGYVFALAYILLVFNIVYGA